MQALSICKRHGEQMSGLTPRLCRTMGLSAYQEGRVGLALEWLLRAHDGRLAGLVVQGLVRRAEAALQVGQSPGFFREPVV